MKESIFNIHMENNGHKLLFNSLYCGLCEIDDTYFEVLKKCNTGMQLSEEENELKLMAVEAGYFVEDDKDEIDFLKVNKYKAKFNPGPGCPLLQGLEDTQPVGAGKHQIHDQHIRLKLLHQLQGPGTVGAGPDAVILVQCLLQALPPLLRGVRNEYLPHILHPLSI